MRGLSLVSALWNLQVGMILSYLSFSFPFSFLFYRSIKYTEQNVHILNAQLMKYISICECIYIYIYIHTHTHVYICVCIYVCMYAYASVTTTHINISILELGLASCSLWAKSGLPFVFVMKVLLGRSHTPLSKCYCLWLLLLYDNAIWVAVSTRWPTKYSLPGPLKEKFLAPIVGDYFLSHLSQYQPLCAILALSVD
jgi:hypothetical protein